MPDAKCGYHILDAFFKRLRTKAHPPENTLHLPISDMDKRSHLCIHSSPLAFLEDQPMKMAEDFRLRRQVLWTAPLQLGSSPTLAPVSSIPPSPVYATPR